MSHVPVHTSIRQNDFHFSPQFIASTTNILTAFGCTESTLQSADPGSLLVCSQLQAKRSLALVNAPGKDMNKLSQTLCSCCIQLHSSVEPWRQLVLRDKSLD